MADDVASAAGEGDTEDLREELEEGAEPEEEELEIPEREKEDPEEKKSPADRDKKSVEGDGEEGIEEPEKKPRYFKVKVNDEEKSVTLDELKDAYNRADFAERSRKRFEEAAEVRKEGERYKADAQHVVALFKTKGPEVLLDLLTGEYGDEELAQEHTVRMLERFLLPIYKERQLQRESPDEWRALQAQRRTERYDRQLSERQRRDAETARGVEREQKTTADRKSEIEFQDKVVVEITKAGIPNDEITESIYMKAKAAAKEAGQEWTPQLAAKIIKARREKLFGKAKPEAAAKTSDDERLENLRKAREVRAAKAEGRRPAEKAKAPRSQRSSKQFLSIDDLREQLTG